MSEFFRKTDLENIFVENVMKDYDIYTSDNMNEYYCWFIGLCFNLLEKQYDCIEFYAKEKHNHKNFNKNLDENVFHEKLMGRLSYNDAYIIIDKQLMIIKDSDVGEYNFQHTPLGTAMYLVPLDDVCFVKIKKEEQ